MKKYVGTPLMVGRGVKITFSISSVRGGRKHGKCKREIPDVQDVEKKGARLKRGGLIPFRGRGRQSTEEVEREI